jgi:hypothetical protein
MTLKITGFVEFIHHLVFYINIKHNVSETGFVSVFGRGEGATYSVGCLRKR